MKYTQKILAKASKITTSTKSTELSKNFSLRTIGRKFPIITKNNLFYLT